MSLQSRLSTLITAVGADIKALNNRAPSSTVTVLPGSPVEGQVVDFLADATNGVIWRLRWRSAGGTYKWEFIGGSPMFQEVDGTYSYRSFAAWVAPTVEAGADAAPSITIPLPGVYRIDLIARTLWSDVSGTVCYLGVSIDGANPTTPMHAFARMVAANNQNSFLVSSFPTFLTAGRVLTLRGAGSGSGWAYSDTVKMLATPVRCGAA
jgi:hypothetical protein